MRWAIVVLLGAAAVSAQPQTPSGVVFLGSLRSRLEAWDWFEAKPADNTYPFSGNILRLSLSQARGPWDWQLEFAAPILLGLPDRAVATGTPGALGLGANYYAANSASRNAAMIFPKQVFLRWRKTVRVGRFEFADGAERVPKDATLAAIKRDRINQRLIGPFGWTHVGRSFDGFQYVQNTRNATYTLTSGIPTRGVFQTDGWGWNRAAVAYAAASWSWGQGNHTAETRLLAIYYQDWRHVVKTDSRPLAVRRQDLNNIRIGTFGGHHLSAWKIVAGTLDLMLWGVGQTGSWGIQDHRAQAFAVEGGFQPAAAASWLKACKPWLRFGYFESSGDANPGDGVHGTFFQILPTPRPFARFPFFNLENIQDVNAALILRPHGKVTVTSEFHALRLASRSDLWYQGGGVFQPWTFGYAGRNAGGARSLANLYDLSIDYRVNPAVTLSGYFGVAQGRAVAAAIYPQNKNARFGYLELTYRFGRPAVK